MGHGPRRFGSLASPSLVLGGKCTAARSGRLELPAPDCVHSDGATIFPDMTAGHAVTIHVPAMLRGCCGGATELSLSATSVRAALEELERQLPSLHRSDLRRDRRRAPPRERVREHRPTCATGRGSTPRSCRETLSRSCPRSQEVEHAGARDSLHRNQEGSLRRRGVEEPGEVRAARTVRTGRGRLLDADRHARHAAPLRLELQRLLRHEGPALDRSRQDVQGDEVGARLPEGRRARARQHLVARTGRRTRRSCGAASSRRRSSGAATAAIPGRWSRASATTSTRGSGSPGPAGSACTRSCATGIGCTSASRPAATT